MRSEVVELIPDVRSVPEAQGRLTTALRGSSYLALGAVASVTAGGWLIASTGDWRKGLGPIVVGVSLLLWFIRLLPLRKPIHSVEVRHLVMDRGVRVSIAVNGRDISTYWIKWNDISSATEDHEAVTLITKGDGTHRIPKRCFASEEQKLDLLARVRA